MNRRGILFFICLVALFACSLLFQRNQMKEEMQLKIQFIEQKNMLRDELDDLIDEHDDLLEEYGDLNNHLHEKDSIIQDQIAEIRNLIRTTSNFKEAREKISILRGIAKKYLANIDSLLVLNEELILEKDSVVRVNKNINWRNYKLNRQNKQLSEKVSKGSVLDFFDIEIIPIRYRRGTGKELATKFAKKVQKVRICFFVGANQISNADIKTGYIQIIDNEGKVVLGKEDVKTTIGDSIINCTSVTTFEYNNIELNHCMDWERVHQLSSGLYQVNLIFEGNITTQATFKLR